MTQTMIHSLVRCVCGCTWTAIYPPDQDTRDLKCPECKMRCSEVVSDLGVSEELREAD